MSLCNEYFLRNCLLYGRRNGTFGTFFIPGLKTVYMVGGTGCLPRRCVFQLEFKNYLYGRRDGVFAGTGRLPGRDICRDETFARTGRLPGPEVCWDGTFARTGRLPERDVYGSYFILFILFRLYGESIAGMVFVLSRLIRISINSSRIRPGRDNSFHIDAASH